MKKILSLSAFAVCAALFVLAQQAPAPKPPQVPKSVLNKVIPPPPPPLTPTPPMVESVPLPATAPVPPPPPPSIN